MRGLGPVSKEGYDERKERSNLVNIMSGMIFPMCHSPTRGVWGVCLYNILLPETHWEFWFCYSKVVKYPGHSLGS